MHSSQISFTLVDKMMESTKKSQKLQKTCNRKKSERSRKKKSRVDVLRNKNFIGGSLLDGLTIYYYLLREKC